MQDSITAWIASQKDRLDNAIAQAATRFFEQSNSKPNFTYDVKVASEEMYALSRQEDLCYDRPAIAFCYAMWYHGTRVSTLVPIFDKLIANAADETQIDIFDIGAGTGAVQWAVAITLLGRQQAGLKIPAVRIINIDSSPFMLDYNKNYLWAEFCKTYPTASSITTVYEINNWLNKVKGSQANNWICASYVFDHLENRESLAEEFKKLVEEVTPSTILLFTSSQNAQFDNLTSISKSLKATYAPFSTGPIEPIFKGSMTQVNAVRNGWQSTVDFNFAGEVKWNKGGFLAQVLIRQQISLPLHVEGIKIYHSPEIERTKVQLTDQQLNAAELSGQPTMIVGPAGCGKSVVLTEKIKRIVERVDKPYDPTIRILLTTFNRKLVRMLGDWLEQLLDPRYCKRIHYETNYHGRIKKKDHCCFVFTGSTTPNIQVLHFDVLPTLIGKVGAKEIKIGKDEYEVYHRNVMKEVVSEYFKAKNLHQEDHAKISDPDFLLDEFARIFYGLQIKSLQPYMSAERTGRGNNPTLQYKTLRRKIVYDCVTSYLKKLGKDKVESFIMRRSRFLAKLASGNVDVKYDHILVDELQDCTRADHQIFLHLIKDPANITFAGDLAQSIQLGSAFHIPGGEEMKRYKKIKLDGSFRLPFRISECLRPLSERINKRYGAREGVEAEIIVPYRGAQPGARPVVVYSPTVIGMAEKIAAIIKDYGLYQLTSTSLFERDHELADEIRKHGIALETDIILASKGLEYSCVIWSSRILADTKLEQQEFAYTIFTRTSSILIIAVFEPIEAVMKDIARVFDNKKAIYWDEETFNHMKNILQDDHMTEETDEDSSELVEQLPKYAEDIDDLIQ